MRYVYMLSICLFSAMNGFAQLEFSTGYAVNKHLADGAPIHIGYEYALAGKFRTKTQSGYKHLYYYNNYIEATIRLDMLELHQTFTYPVLNKKKYILKPNAGINLRYYKAVAKIDPPYNAPPQRVWILRYTRNRTVRLNSYDDPTTTKEDIYRVTNLGFSFQLQNQFYLTPKIWLHITPFIEPDYDKTQVTGGCYVGVVLKQK